MLLEAKATVALWRPAIACLLQGQTALHRAAEAGHVDVVETLLLNGVDPEFKDAVVSCRFSMDTAYIACQVLISISNLVAAIATSMCHASCGPTMQYIL